MDARPSVVWNGWDSAINVLLRESLSLKLEGMGKMPCKYLRNVVITTEGSENGPSEGTGECSLVDDLAPGEDPFVRVYDDDCECVTECYPGRAG